MDSFAVADKTLPLDLNGSSNPDHLTAVSYTEHGSSATSMTELSSTGCTSVMELSSSRRSSPIRWRTMKEYDKQLQDLKKENFNLKLRIYFMQEHKSDKFNNEDIIQTNIDLKVELENYKSDLNKKTALLEKASETIDALTTRYSEELEKGVVHIKQECEDKVEMANQRIAKLQVEMRVLNTRLEEMDSQKSEMELMSKQLKNLNVGLEDKTREITKLFGDLDARQKEITHLQQQISKNDERHLEEIEALTTNLGRKDRDVKRLSMFVEEKTKVDGLTVLERAQLEDAVEDMQRSLAKFQEKCTAQEQMLEQNRDTILKLEDLLKTKEKDKQAIRKAYEARTAVYNTSKGVIQELTRKSHQLIQENERLESELKVLRDEFNEQRQELELTQADRQKEADHVEDIQKVIEKLMNTLRMKDEELKHLRDLLEKTTASLNVSEAAVENISCLKGENIRLGQELEFMKSRLSELEKINQSKCADLEELTKLYQIRCAEMDSVAKQFNIAMETTLPADGNASISLQQILTGIKTWKGALDKERHIHIDMSTTQTTFDIKPISCGGSSISGLGSSMNSKSIELEHLKQLVSQLTAQNQDQQKMLKATEETVHFQTQKMKYYRTLLIENGLLSRSSSVPSTRLSLFPQSRQETRGRCFSSEHSPFRHRSFSPTPKKAFGLHAVYENINDNEKLLQENNKLKHEIDGYKRMLKVFKDRSHSQNSSSDFDRSWKDEEPVPIHTESPKCQLESWLDMFEKLLVDLSQNDIDSLMALPKLQQEISHLRMGLVFARGALQSMLEQILGVSDRRLSKGGLSTGSVSSDHITTSAVNTVNLSPGYACRATLADLSPTRTSSQKYHGTSVHKYASTSPQNDTGIQTSISPQNEMCSKFSPYRLNHSSGQLHQVSFDQMGGGTLVTLPIVINVSIDNNSSTNNSLVSDLQSNVNENSLVHSVDSRDPSHGSYNSVETLRHCSDYTDQKDLSTFSSDVFSLSAPKLSSNVIAWQLCSLHGASSSNQCPPTCLDSGEKSHSPPTCRDSGEKGHTQLTCLDSFEKSHSPPSCPDSEKSHSPPTCRDSDGKVEYKEWDKTLSQTFLECIDSDNNAADMTVNVEAFSLIEDIDKKVCLDVTRNPLPYDSHNRQQMREQINSLEEVIRSYEKQLKEQNCPNMDSLQQFLQELRMLRLQLEKSMNENENLKKELLELHRLADSRIKEFHMEIGNLKNELAESHDNVAVQDKIILEKDEAIKEMNFTLIKYKENSLKDCSDLETYRGKIKSLENKLKNNTVAVDQLTKMCQDLKVVVEQYKRRCEQLETDNRTHINSALQYQSKIIDIEMELEERKENAEKINSETVALQTRIQQLEIDGNEFRDNELKYKNALAQSVAQVNNLFEEIETLKLDCKKSLDALISVRSELDRSRDTIEEQHQQLLEKNTVIQQLNEENQMKTEFLNQEKNISAEIRKECVDLSEVKCKLNTQLEQQQLTCADNKQRIEKQNYIIKDLKDCIDKLKEELTQSIHERESLDKELSEKQNELHEVTRLRDKYLYNLKVTFKSCMRYKSELKDAKSKLDETSVLNSSLKTELNVRERLMEAQDHLTDDEKKNMIMELLRELKGARDQMLKIVEQNNTINKQLREYINKEKEDAFGDKVAVFETDTNTSSDSQLSKADSATNSFGFDGANNNWPMCVDLSGGLARNDNFSASLLVRSSTDSGQNTPSSLCSLQQNREMANSAVLTSMVHTADGANTGVLSGFHDSSKTNIQGLMYKEEMIGNGQLYEAKDSPECVKGQTQVPMDSDSHSQLAVTMIDIYEKLCKLTNECKETLNDHLHCITETLRMIAGKHTLDSVEYTTLIELLYGTNGLRIDVDSLVSSFHCFWIVDGHAPNHMREVFNQHRQLLDQNVHHKKELVDLITSKASEISQLQQDKIGQSLESPPDEMTPDDHHLQP